MKKMDSVVIRRILCTWLFTVCSSQFLCPPAEIGSSVEFICNHSNSSSIFFNTPSGTIAAACTPTCSVLASRYTGSYINETQTRLTILKVEHRDGGTWTCQYGTEEKNVKCNLNLYTIPLCTLSSDKDTEKLSLDEEVSLSMKIHRAYCSENNTFILVTGNTTQLFTGKPGNFTYVFETRFNVTPSHIGSVSGSFQCLNQVSSLNCTGVHVLAEGGFDSGSSQELNVIMVVGITLGCLIPTLIVGVLIGRAVCQRRRKMRS